MQCLRIAAAKASAITDMIKKQVESHNTERALKKIKRHSSSVPMDDRGASKKGQKENTVNPDGFSSHHVKRIKQASKESTANQSGDVESENTFSDEIQINRSSEDAKSFIGGPSRWDPYSAGVDSDFLKASLASQGTPLPFEKREDSKGEQIEKAEPEDAEDNNSMASPLRKAEPAQQVNGEKTLKDAVKTKNKKVGRKSRSSSGPS